MTRPYYNTEEFKARWLSDEPTADIAEDLGVTRQALYKAVQARGLPPRVRLGRKQRRKEET